MPVENTGTYLRVRLLLNTLQCFQFHLEKKLESYVHILCVWPCTSALPIASWTASPDDPPPTITSSLHSVHSRHTGFLQLLPQDSWVRSILCLECASSR